MCIRDRYYTLHLCYFYHTVLFLFRGRECKFGCSLTHWHCYHLRLWFNKLNLSSVIIIRTTVLNSYSYCVISCGLTKHSNIVVSRSQILTRDSQWIPCTKYKIISILIEIIKTRILSLPRHQQRDIALKNSGVELKLCGIINREKLKSIVINRSFLNWSPCWSTLDQPLSYCIFTDLQLNLTFLSSCQRVGCDRDVEFTSIWKFSLIWW